MHVNWIKRRLRGSYTIEAAFVMSLTLWAVAFSVQAACLVRDETVGNMMLAEALSQLCHGEKEQASEVALSGIARTGPPLSWSAYELGLERSGNLLTGEKTKGTASGGKWSLSIERRVFDPENFLRKISLLDQEDIHED